MLILRNIIITVLLIILAAISIVGLMVEAPTVFSWTPDRINALGRSVLVVMRPGYLLFMVWWLILLGTLLVFFVTVARPGQRMKIEVQMGGGKVVIMDAAIKKYIRNALSELGEVNVKKIDLREQRGMVKTDIYTDVRTRENLPILERRIISRVRGALAEDLGITNLGDVHVFIRNFEVTGRPIKAEPIKPKKADHKPTTDDSREQLTASKDESTGAAAALGALSGTIEEQDAAEANHPLTEPIEPPGAAEPVIITDNDTDENQDFSETSFDKNPGITETSDSDDIIVAEKSLSSQNDAPSAVNHNDDIDEHLPWEQGNDVKSDDDKKDSRPL